MVYSVRFWECVSGNLAIGGVVVHCKIELNIVVSCAGDSSTTIRPPRWVCRGIGRTHTHHL
jgi:hypothetical protein